MQEDAILVKQTILENKEAFHQLVKKYRASIYTMILSKVRNVDDAQDLTQETFLEAFRDLSLLKNPECFYSWLCQIARHQCYDWQRKNHNNQVTLDESLKFETLTADEMIAYDELMVNVIQVIDELPEIDRDLMKSYYLDNISYVELQAKHKLSYKGVTNRIFRARQKVRKKLSKPRLGFTMSTDQNIASQDESIKERTVKMNNETTEPNAKKPLIVKDFPEFDLSSPESAYATINHLIIKTDEDWIKVNVKRDHEDDMSIEDKENFLNAEILEVHHYKENKCAVIARIPNQDHAEPWRGPIDIRWLEKEDGEWRNCGNDRQYNTIEKARQRVEFRKGTDWG
jgi:RNA polymerase sigma factor (sigma-70 family)